MLTLNSPAKINLFLNIRGLRPDGFHEIVTVMQTINLHDVLQVDITETPGLTLECSVPGLNENNLVTKTWQLFRDETGFELPGLRVALEKNIPTQAGLGGGSSNAATMLLALNELTGKRLSKKDLSALAARLGSDVPFFLTGGTALATGRGEIIESLETTPPDTPIVVVKPPNEGMSTARAYTLYRERGIYQTEPVEPILKALVSGENWANYLHNDFESVVLPELQALQEVKAMTTTPSLLCGSGSAIFCLGSPSTELNPSLWIRETTLLKPIYV